MERRGGGTLGTPAIHRVTFECEILTLALCALHGKNEVESRWCPPPPSPIGAVPPPVQCRYLIISYRKVRFPYSPISFCISSGFTRCRCRRRCRHHCCCCCRRRHPRLLPPRPRAASALPAAPGSTTAQLPVSVPVEASAAPQTQAAEQRVARHQQVAQEVRHGPVDPRVLAVVVQPVLADPLVGGLGRLLRYHPRRSSRARPAARRAGSGQNTVGRSVMFELDLTKGRRVSAGTNWSPLYRNARGFYSC